MPEVNLSKIFRAEHLCVDVMQIPNDQDPLSIPAVDENYIFEYNVLCLLGGQIIQ